LELREDEGDQFTLWLDDECIADSPHYESAEALDAAMLRVREALATLVE
ncbi:MAG: tryptophan--tRNA ligase, partial [Pseudomonas sp.]|nr:tryptophan--tRNA ligase [Pseudomonas sp.]